MLGNFVEVWLAKEGHDGLVGMNFLEKVQLATPSAALRRDARRRRLRADGRRHPAGDPRVLDPLAGHDRPGCRSTSRDAERRARR